MTSGIYLVTCLTNGRRYVGSSKKIEYRWKKHREQLRAKNHCNPRWQNSWNKYGEDKFVLSVLETVDNESDLRDREQYWMDFLRPEFNIAPMADRPPGTTGRIPTRKQRLSASIGNKLYWENLSDEERSERGILATHPHTEETKALLREKTKLAYAEGRLSRVRRPRTEQEKANILAGMADHLEKKRADAEIRRQEWEAGREEREMIRREKISRANTGKPVSEETREKLRVLATEQMSDPEMQERHRQATTEAMQRPEVKEKMRQRPKPVFTEERKQKVSERHTGRKNTPESIEKMREARRQWWADKKAKQKTEE